VVIKMPIIYKIVEMDLWHEMERVSLSFGSAADKRDGYIHFSDRSQVAETAAKHFANQRDLLLVAVQSERLGSHLRWEAARGGALFPHLYGSWHKSSVVFVEPLPLGPDGLHIFPKFPA
jgi:uncharacterized protein (DUF952 family)